MPKTGITINRSSQVVWDFITKPENWEKWWGASLKKVEPGWQSGATLTWGNDQRSNLAKVKDQEEIHISSMFMKTAYLFKAVDDKNTLVEYEFNPSGEASFSDGGAAHKATIYMKLAKLKNCIEKETAENIGSVTKKCMNELCCPHCGKELTGMTKILIESALKSDEVIDSASPCPSCRKMIRKEDFKEQQQE